MKKYKVKGTLKTLPQYYKRVKSGEKKFEVRLNDRDFQVNDIYYLRYFNPNNEKDLRPYNIPILITYVFTGGKYGLSDEYCVFGFKKLKIKDLRKLKII